jgi:hypothetical protein
MKSTYWRSGSSSSSISIRVLCPRRLIRYIAPDESMSVAMRSAFVDSSRIEIVLGFGISSRIGTIFEHGN